MNPTNSDTENKLDPSALNLMRAIRTKESGGNYNAVGDVGTSTGAFQFQEPTWKSYAKQVLGDENAQQTKANQNQVAYTKVKEWKDKGWSPEQVAAAWNSGEKRAQDGSWKDNVGDKTINGKTVHFDTPSYVNDVISIAKKSKGINNPNTQAAPLIQPTVPKEDTTLKADTGKGILGKTVGVLGDVSGVTKLGEGLGYGLSNLMGTQKGLVKTNEQAIDIQSNLLKQIKQNKAQGKDTSRLEKALSDLSQNIQKTGSQVSDVGTGGISNSDVLKSAVQTGVTVATLPSLISGGINLLKGAGLFKSPAVLDGLKRVGLNSEKFAALANGDKVEALTEALTRATPTNKIVLQQAIDKISPLAIKEAGGVVEFAKLHPNIAKIGGLIKGGLKSLGGIATGAALGIEGQNIYNSIAKHL